MRETGWGNLEQLWRQVAEVRDLLGRLERLARDGRAAPHEVGKAVRRSAAALRAVGLLRGPASDSAPRR
jgi:hypothetical protein